MLAPRVGEDPFGQAFVLGRYALVGRAGGEVPRLGAELTATDHLGGLKVRWGIGRYDYRVVPGLYALGIPDAESPVLVSANYKLSFDRLRKELGGLSAWVLVLETLGINVWCAAGKGTFGTAEICRQVEATGLARVVSHRRLIVPQLGAPGVAAHEVKARTGFRVVYGPIEARDLPAFLAAKLQAEPRMRRKRFPFRERAALVPMELVPALQYTLPLAAVLVVFAALLGPGGDWMARLWGPGLLVALALLVGVLCGAVLTPLGLPWIPGRAFAAKGALVALGVGLPLIHGLGALLPGRLLGRPLDLAALSAIAVALSSFLAMSFTGSSTYTSLSGVEREMRAAVPLQLVVGGLGLVTWGLSVALVR